MIDESFLQRGIACDRQWETLLDVRLVCTQFVGVRGLLFRSYVECPTLNVYFECPTLNVLDGMSYVECPTLNVLHGMSYIECPAQNLLFFVVKI